MDIVDSMLFIRSSMEEELGGENRERKEGWGGCKSGSFSATRPTAATGVCATFTVDEDSMRRNAEPPDEESERMLVSRPRQL